MAKPDAGDLAGQALEQLKALQCDRCGLNFEQLIADGTLNMLAGQLLLMARVFGKPVLCEDCRTKWPE